MTLRGAVCLAAVLALAGLAAASAQEVVAPPEAPEVYVPPPVAGAADENTGAAAAAPAPASPAQPTPPNPAPAVLPAEGARVLDVLSAESPKVPDPPPPPLPAAAGPEAPATARNAGNPPGAAPAPFAPSAAGGIAFAPACPHAELRALIRSVTNTNDVIAALAMERETLVLCRDRQKLLSELLDLERKFRKRDAGGSTPAPPTSLTFELPSGEELAKQFLAEIMSSPELRKLLEGNGPALAAGTVPAGFVDQLSDAASPTGGGAPTPAPAEDDSAIQAETAAPEVATASASAAPPSPTRQSRRRLFWFSIIGSHGRLRAGISDGRDTWFARRGDSLPGGRRIDRIRSTPPGVRLGDGTELPYLKARPAPAPGS